MTRFALLSLALLAGCAGITPQEAAQKLPHLADIEVCKGAMLARPEIAGMAQGEANRRGLDCSRYAGAIMQQQANQNAAVQNYINTLNPPVQQRQMTNCRTVRNGNSLDTICF